MIKLATHPLARIQAFVARFPRPLGELETPPELAAGLGLDYPAPVKASDDATRKAVRDLLRAGGFKPSGRSKPASEFLLRAATREELGSINPAVDLCNVVSLHSGLPISVVDLDRLTPPLSIDIAAPGSSYVFNPAGQTIKLDGLLCLHDGAGPCANPVKDSQRSKTHAGTRATLCVVWGSVPLAARCDAAFEWYRELHEGLGFASAALTLA